MAKRLLLNVLLAILGDYIEDLAADNLKLGVWSGEIVLNDLGINRKILQKLGIPVKVVHGLIKRLSVTIPWASLDSNSVKITADGVYLHVSPLDLSVLNAKDLSGRSLTMKRHKLEQADKLFDSSTETAETNDKDQDSAPSRGGACCCLRLQIRPAAGRQHQSALPRTPPANAGVTDCE